MNSYFIQKLFYFNLKLNWLHSRQLLFKLLFKTQFPIIGGGVVDRSANLLVC